MNETDKVFVTHILDAIGKIEEYIGDVGYDAFVENSMMCDAVVRELEIIGEATKSLSDEVKEAHGNIPWKSISGMRDKLIHQYFGVDLEIVWKTCKEDLVGIKDKLNELSSTG